MTRLTMCLYLKQTHIVTSVNVVLNQTHIGTSVNVVLKQTHIVTSVNVVLKHCLCVPYYKACGNSTTNSLPKINQR